MIFREIKNIKLALYIHIPWCVRKCPYCDFNSHEVKRGLPEIEYVDALLTDIEQDLPLIWGRSISSIFIGGGTPSLFSPEAIDRLLSGVRSRLMISPHAEITLEANPGAVEQGKFTEFHALGINRLSVGVQSFNNEQLAALGRIHNRAEAIKAIETAHSAGFDNFNIDLMFGLPGQTVATVSEDVNTAIQLEPTHISFYQLTLEPNTLFYRSPPSLPHDDLIGAIQSRGQALLADNDFKQYEVSAYARPDGQCKHNLNYWRFGDYLGIGAGAHAKITDMAQKQISRLAKLRHPHAYMDDITQAGRIQSQRVLDESDIILEFMMNALRLSDGFELELFEQHTGMSRREIEPLLQQAIDRKLLNREQDHLCPTELGARFLDDLIQMFDRNG